MSEFQPSDSFFLFGVKVGVFRLAPRNAYPVFCKMSYKLALASCRALSFFNDLPQIFLPTRSAFQNNMALPAATANKGILISPDRGKQFAICSLALCDREQYLLLFARLQIACSQCLVEIVSLSF